MLFVHIHWFTETPRLRHSDVSYALSMVLNMLSPPPAQVVQTHHNSTNQKPGHHHYLSMSENHRCSSFSHHIDKRHDNELVLHVAFLGRIFYFLVINRGRSRHFHKGGPFRISKQFVIRIPRHKSKHDKKKNDQDEIEDILFKHVLSVYNFYSSWPILQNC